MSNPLDDDLSELLKKHKVKNYIFMTHGPNGEATTDACMEGDGAVHLYSLMAITMRRMENRMLSSRRTETPVTSGENNDQ